MNHRLSETCTESIMVFGGGRKGEGSSRSFSAMSITKKRAAVPAHGSRFQVVKSNAFKAT